MGIRPIEYEIEDLYEMSTLISELKCHTFVPTRNSYKADPFPLHMQLENAELLPKTTSGHLSRKSDKSQEL